MAQYELVLVKNDSVSGVSYSEYTLQKPPATGYSLTQHPSTGALSWVQSMNNGGVVSGDFNNYTEIGYYIIPDTGTFANDPKYIDGVLQVFKTTSGVIYQTAYVKPPTNPTNPTTFVRHFRPGSPGVWTSWAAVELVYEVPIRPPEDLRAPYSDESDGSIVASLRAVENALMDHTLDHVRFMTDLEVSTGDWEYIVDFGGCYMATVYVDGLDISDAVDVVPSNWYRDMVIEAEMFPQVNIDNGLIQIYCKNIPSDSIEINIRVIKK